MKFTFFFLIFFSLLLIECVAQPSPGQGCRIDAYSGEPLARVYQVPTSPAVVRNGSAVYQGNTTNSAWEGVDQANPAYACYRFLSTSTRCYVRYGSASCTQNSCFREGTIGTFTTGNFPCPIDDYFYLPAIFIIVLGVYKLRFRPLNIYLSKHQPL